jgi:GxxExxY protein
MSHGFARTLTDQAGFSGVNSLVMDSPPTLKHAPLTKRTLGLFYDVYHELGYGLLESTYAEAMVVALAQPGLGAGREVPVPVWYRGQKVGQYFADLRVDNAVLLELKAARNLESAHEAQLPHYLRATENEVGLLPNFGLRPQFRHLLFDNKRKKIRENPCESVAKVLA